jgi:putative FmdB family regulatory protein
VSKGEGLFRPITAKIITMPLYEYQCTKCKHRFERIRKFSDRPISKCPECGSKVEQLISAAAVQFKGSGWYVTDYAKKSSSGSSESGASDSGSSDGGSSAKLVEKDSGGKDSKDGSPKSDSSSDSSSDAKSGSKSQPKSDAKPESRSDSKSGSKKSDKKKS